MHTRRKRRLLVGCGWLAAVLLVVFGIGFYVALQGPLSVGYLAHAVQARLSSDRTKVTIGAATLDMSEGFPARIELVNVTIEADGEVPVSVVVPRISAPLDLGAALGGRIAVSAVVLEQPRLTIRPGARGTSEIPDMDQLSLAADSVARLALEHLAERTIQGIELVSAELVSQGEETYRIRGIDARLTREGDDTLTMTAEIAGRLGRWRVALRRNVDADTGARLIRLDVDDVTLGEFLPTETAIRAGRGLGVPVDIRLETELDAAGAFKATRLSTVVSPGWVNTGRTIVGFDRIDVQAQWLAGTTGFQIAPSYYVRGKTVIPFEGAVEPPQDWQQRWSFRIVSRGAVIGPSDVPGPPYEMDMFVAEGDADLATRDIGFSRLMLRSATANLDGVGSLRLAKDGPYLALAIESGPMAVATLKRLWPITMVPPARDWVIEHVIDGRVDSGRATIALRPPAFDIDDPDPGWAGNDVNVDVALSDLSVKTIGTVPIVQGLGGRLTVADEILTARMEGGGIAARSGEQLALPDATFSIPDVRVSGDKTGVLNLHVEGAAEAVATVLDAEPLRLLSERGLSPDGISGTAKATLDARFPLVKDLDLDEVDWKLSGTLRRFASDKPIQGSRITAADLAFDADPTRLKLKGRGRLDGLPADLDLVVPLGGEGKDVVAARQGVVLDVTADQLASRGIDLRQFVNGSMRLSLDETGEGQAFDIDLTRARVDLAQVGWTKSPGVPARARFTKVEAGGKREIRGFELTSDGVEITGSLTLDGRGDLQRAQFSRFALRPSDDATLRISRDGKTYVADFRASRFDGRGLVTSLTGGPRGEAKGGKGGKESYRVNAEIDQMTGFNDVSLANVSLRATIAGGIVRALSASGRTSASGAFQFALSPSDKTRVLSGSIGDTGALLRFANLYDRMRGGAGRLDITMRADEQWSGQFRVTRLAITEDPAIRALAQAPVVTDRDPRQRQQVFAGSERNGEASFSELRLTFVRGGDRLEITEGTLTGATIGGTVSGTVNLAARTLDLTGTFVPAFALNNLFARIPILGFALGGGSDEGLIGVTYKLTGAIGDPVLTVNPASMIAPGIFRKLFEYR